MDSLHFMFFPHFNELQTLHGKYSLQYPRCTSWWYSTSMRSSHFMHELHFNVINALHISPPLQWIGNTSWW